MMVFAMPTGFGPLKRPNTFSLSLLTSETFVSGDKSGCSFLHKPAHFSHPRMSAIYVLGRRLHIFDTSHPKMRTTYLGVS